jgi:hypothetical protein
MQPRPEDNIPFRTKPEDARFDSPWVKLPSGIYVSALPLADGVAPMLENGMFLRASLARIDVVAAAAQFGGIPITREDFLEMCVVGLWTPARPLTATPYGVAHMTSLGFTQRHDDAWWSDIERLHVRDSMKSLHEWIESLQLPVLCGKSHAASRGAPLVVDRMVGGDGTDDKRPDLIQDGTKPNHARQPDVRDYWTKTYIKRDR